MSDRTLRDAVEGDFESILALNRAEEQQTSPMDMDKFLHLHSLATYRKVVTVDGDIAAFILAMRDGAAYRNDNYDWFAARYESFLYVDRIVVAADYSGLGIGSLLYKDLFSYADFLGAEFVCCEYNIEPPNLASKVFHDKFGFQEQGSQRVANGAKLVSLQAEKLI